jgi:hypothetical protein
MDDAVERLKAVTSVLYQLLPFSAVTLQLLSSFSAIGCRVWDGTTHASLFVNSHGLLRCVHSFQATTAGKLY